MAILTDDLPARLQDLVARYDAAIANLQTPATTFCDELLGNIPALHSYAHALTRNEERANDLVQETLLRAWQAQAQFGPGTNLSAWLTTVLRNQFYTTCRKRRREVEDVDGVVAGRMTAQPNQTDWIEMKEAWIAMSILPVAQREALLLVGWHNCTYEDAALLLGCRTGTVKSRVSRARVALAARLGRDPGANARSSLTAATDDPNSLRCHHTP
ncbi:sigma-70 family RNA polymerase sigma factor [Methylobacterium oryzisoli]|uniref:sigma-70 family RNA polymerase sigma factor n=1 Tax=Methylobacterium oryzisoli TaxID=3385502 RepID=UPI0038919A48